MTETSYKVANEFSTTIRTSKILGKSVIARNGKRIGKLKEIHIHPTRLTVEAIRVDKGVLDDKRIISKHYIASIGTKGAMLNIVPAEDMVGMKVYDFGGTKIGKVSKVTRDRPTNRVRTLTIRRGLVRGSMTVPGSQIKDVGENVVLRTSVRDDHAPR